MTRAEPSVSRSGRAVVAASLLAILGTGCTDFAGYDLDYILGRVPVLSTMRTSVAYESHSLPRLPAPGTVPVISPAGDAGPAFSQLQLDSAAATLSNPLPASAEVLARGAHVYEIQCAVCHGVQGEGNGPVVGAGKFPMGPALNGSATAARSDGYIYAVIRAGRGLMPPYGNRIPHEDRWSVVHYVRQLQAQAGQSPAAAPAQAPAGQ